MLIRILSRTRALLPILVGLLSVQVTAQEGVNIYSEQDNYSITIYADNDEVIPMTVDLSLNLTGMKSDFGGSKKKFVIPANSKNHKLTLVTPKARARQMGVNFNSRIYFGDFTVNHDDNHIYQLPYERSKRVEISQGYNGRFSHHGENALDFSMEVGEKVYAARSGTVFKIVKHNNKSCRSSSCHKYNNYILIYHEDGTLAEYSHLKLNGVKVSVGDKVKAGELIGLSGNTGWTSGPHLHFVVYNTTTNGKRLTHKTKFSTHEGEGIYLKEDRSYTK